MAHSDQQPAKPPPPEADREHTPESGAEPGPPPLGGDFAEEHSEVTFADEVPGGPEGEKEPESPQGYAGLESRGVGRRSGRRD